MGNGEDAPLTLGVFDEYVMRLEENMATKADMADVKARIDRVESGLGPRIDRVESGTWTRLTGWRRTWPPRLT